MTDPFAGFDVEHAIVSRANAAGIRLDASAAAALAAHARAVLDAGERLHLTSIRQPAEFVERHIGESMEGAALIDPGSSGTLIDVGSGNGYPGVPIAVARPRLRCTLVDASERRAAFLDGLRGIAGLRCFDVQVRQIQGARDIVSEPDWITMRAVGGWQRLVPKLAGRLAAGGALLLWAGVDVESARSRASWRKTTVTRRVALPGRRSSWVWSIKSL